MGDTTSAHADEIRAADPNPEAAFARGNLPAELLAGRPFCWLNPACRAVDPEAMAAARVEIAAAEARLRRFAPAIARAFPETAESGGIIESPLLRADASADRFGLEAGHLLVKLDGQLPVAGSVKARGGVYEVLEFAEKVAAAEGLIDTPDSAGNANYAALLEPACRDVFSRYTVQVGSTGNLGLSIGMTASAFGFSTIVHMSTDAKQWKKDLLRAHGVRVVEYAGDYGMAVAQGRAQSAADPSSHFVDDESSRSLFVGYATAGPRLAEQLREFAVPVDTAHPLFVYIPCGVGGAPGGIAYGLKSTFGDGAHVFFAEPTQCCCMLVGLASGLYENISVTDVGLSGRTTADGLAVARCSSLVSHTVEPCISGEFTVDDGRLVDYLCDFEDDEGIFVEPSGCAGFAGPDRFLDDSVIAGYVNQHGLAPESITHLVWTTGGSLVPEEARDDYIAGR